jgi:hypothetical protein
LKLQESKLFLASIPLLQASKDKPRPIGSSIKQGWSSYEGNFSEFSSLRFSLNSSLFFMIFGWLKSYQCRKQDWVALRPNWSNSDHAPQISNPRIFQYTWNWRKLRQDSSSWAFFSLKSCPCFSFWWWLVVIQSGEVTGEDDQSPYSGGVVACSQPFDPFKMF